MEIAVLILIATPIVLPVAMNVGMYPVNFSVVMMLALGIGLITWPVVTMIFVGSATGKYPMKKRKRVIAFLLCHDRNITARSIYTGSCTMTTGNFSSVNI